jgi:shikimate dehydrogenase
MYFKLGILGHPLSHTLSPILHQALLAKSQLKGEYLPYDIPPKQLSAHLSKFIAEGGHGLNVTIPHKVAVMPLLNVISQNAQLIGAVNTITIKPDGNSHGENTDIIGFTESLPSLLKQQLPQQHIVLLGAGGSARAVLAGLIQVGTQKITIVARQIEKATSLKESGLQMRTAYQTQTHIETCLFSDLKTLGSAQGIINTTPLGMWPHPDESPLSESVLKHLLQASPDSSKKFVYDLIYKPHDTQLLKQAQNLNVQTFNGLDMLILQGVAAFKLWTHAELPSSESFLEVLRQVLRRALN